MTEIPPPNPVASERPRQRTFAALSIPNFRLYFMGGMISNVGTWMSRVAQDWLVLKPLGHGALELGIVTALQFIPVLLLGAFAGVIADRFPKRGLLMVTQSLMAVFTLLLGLFAVTGHASLALVYVSAVGLGIGSALDTPARSSFVSEMVDREHLTNAVGINAVSFQAGRLIGPALAGLLIAALGSGEAACGVVMVVNAVSYLAVIGQLQRMNPQLLTPAIRLGGTRGAFTEGVRYVRARPVLICILIAVFFAGTFGMNFQLTSALMATQVFGKGSAEFGLLGTAQAVGAILAGFLNARRRKNPLWLILGAALSFGLIAAVAGSMPTYGLFALCCPVIGFFMVTLLNGSNSRMQMSAEGPVRGRVMAIYFTVVQGGTPFGSTFIGWVGDVLGPRSTLWMGGGLTVLGVLLAAAFLRSRDLSVLSGKR